MEGNFTFNLFLVGFGETWWDWAPLSYIFVCLENFDMKEMRTLELHKLLSRVLHLKVFRIEEEERPSFSGFIRSTLILIRFLLTIQKACLSGKELRILKKKKQNIQNTKIQNKKIRNKKY